ncbi:hypothetical protein ACFWVC_16460 [Streptomyces sp. NPDC058691]|uniref:hypothetical protein n=1 Tax=Streptomyces sp. NPDC058691 TaxID=3346601 RepID=UPI00365827A3
MTAPSLHSSADLASLSPELRHDLRGYADLGGFTLTAATHAWYAAAETVGGPEEARAASTVFTELRVRDLPAVVKAASRIGEGTDFDAPGTVEETERIVALLLRVRSTLRTLSPEAYELSDADLDELIAATANGAWRRERGLKLSWLRRRTPGKRARSLASGRARRDALHAALTATSADRADWAALEVPGRPALPADADFLDEAARASQAAIEGLRELGRLLRSEGDLAALPFADLAGLLERLAADEGTLFRLPTLRATRDRLTEGGLADLLADLTEQRADSAALAVLLGETEAAGTASVPAPRSSTDADAEPEAAPAPAVDVEVAEPETAPAAPDDVPEVEEASASEPEALASVESEPAAEAPEPEPEAEAVASPESEALTSAPSEPVAEVEPEAPSEPEALTPVASEPVAEVEPEAPSEPEALTPAPSEPVAEAPEPEPEVVAEPAVEPEPEPAPEAASKSEPVTVPEAVAPAEPEAAASDQDQDQDQDLGEGEPATAPTEARPAKPAIVAGKAVTAYKPEELVAIVRWLDTDGVKRTDDELLRAAMKELGFARLGPRIKEALGAAIAAVRA